MNNLKTVLQQLKSDKIKERQEGLSAIRTVFAQDKVVANFHIDRNGNGDPRAWLSVFQALFHAVLNEKLACTKKTTSKSAGSSATAERRLADAASAVRWLTERTAHLMNKRVAKALFEHLLQTMVHKGELLTPVALDYVKALRCLVSWTPHVEHMDEDSWVRMVEMAFNVVLGDPVRASFQDDKSDQGGGNGLDAEDSEYFVGEFDEDENDQDNLPSSSTYAQSKKRRRREQSATPRPSKGRSQMKSKHTHRQVQVSLEQVEFTSLLHLLLHSSSAPILSSSYPHLASSILVRLQRFLDLYPTDTSLHHDYLLAVSSTLSHLSLNKKNDVQNFARETWGGLVGLWGTKNKRMKEGLVAVLRVLFPFVTADDDNSLATTTASGYGWAEGIGRLWHLLDGEADSRWGVDGLSFDSLRLEVVESDELEATELAGERAFVARTYRAGWNFDAGQALAWAILELQADCAEKLFLLSESVHGSAPGTVRGDGKRARLENPITTLLYSIQTQASSPIRAYHLQILLFFIDRHWSILHDTLQQDVVSTLLQFVSFDDGVIQSWTFMCFAAIAYADFHRTSPIKASRKPTSRSPSRSSFGDFPHDLDATTWDPIWTHAIRRANVPIVCRAACHTAHALLMYSQIHLSARPLLTSNRILLEIETFAKDLDVQGPSYPYDSVCIFLAHCLRVASQDVRLYRMQLEDKVLSWLVDCWRVGDVGGVSGGATDSGRMSLHTVRDILLLLESICGFSKRSDLVCRLMLPECWIVDTLIEEGRTKVIRDFLLSAALPPFRKPGKRRNVKHVGSTAGVAAGPGIKEVVTVGADGVDLIQPRGRERKISAFMLKCLEQLVSEWQVIKDGNGHPTAEKARRSLDTAVIALCFESILILNGTHSNRHVVQCACKLFVLATDRLTDVRWTVAEKALVLLGLEPLVSTGEEEQDNERWEAMLPPDIGTGIKTRTLKALILDGEHSLGHVTARRRDFQRIIWQSTDVQDVFGTVMNVLKNVLRIVVDETPNSSHSLHVMDIDDKDGFGPIRTTVTQQSPEVNQKNEGASSTRYIAEVCTMFIAVVPILQSSSGEPTRDKDLTELILGCAELRPEKFLLLCPIFLDKIRQRTLNLTVHNLDKFLDEFAKLLQLYTYARSERLQLLATHFLDSTLHIWLIQPVAASEVGDKVRQLHEWLSGTLRKQKIRAWKIRDSLARFFDRYLACDPSQAAWSGPDEDEDEQQKLERLNSLPSVLLPMMGSDEDIRIRFRVAVVNARLFAIARRVEHPALVMYDTIKRWYTIDLDNYEHMLTRMLSLGNIMVVSSAVRRGPYWHLLETCLHSPLYSRHIEAILSSVSERMGLTSFSVLFEAYASQLAYSIRQAKLDFLLFPPHLLGYGDRKECAEANFRAFTPTNVLAGGPRPEAIIHGHNLFESHCRVIQKSVPEGIRECFGDIVGYQVLTWIDEVNDGKDEVLEQLLKTKTMDGGDPGNFDDTLERGVDGIVASILRTLGDQDFTPKGAIVCSLQAVDNSGEAAPAFQSMARYRRTDDFETHEPNLPAFSTETVLKALTWFSTRVPAAQMKATTYHVLHELFADVQHSPLVNEQIRLINAISLWIAFHHHDFEDPTLLHMLIHGATSLLAESDLARAAQSMLEWAFSYYRKAKIKDLRLPDILIRICCLAQDYARNTQDIAVADMGNDLTRWIDCQVWNLSKVSALRGQILQALPAWPHQPSPELTQLYETVTSESLSAVLSDYRISSNKFRSVRRLRDHAVSNDYGEAQFATTDFWRLKECIPSANQLQDDDVDAFAVLLVLNKGRINSFGSEQPNSMSVRGRHLRGVQKKASPSREDGTSPRNPIVLSLLAMLDGDTPSQVHLAYRTLRLLMSVSTLDISHTQALPPEYRVELQYLQTYPRVPRARPLRDMSEILALESYIDSARDFPRWIAMITTLLSDILAARDSFYAQLTSILQSDVAFAEDMLPILVHTVLQAEKLDENKIEVSSRTLLSNYFTSILSSACASVPCLRSIVDIVLHLRHFRPRSNDALAHDKWLDIDFTLLASNAITCGAYTTALLFLQLAAEYQGAAIAEDTAAERILFDIYSHIDEPDGFYGIKTKDLNHFLIKRFHHEKQWEKAFRFHGAALEAGNTDSSNAEGLLQSFHSFGFDHLAIDTLQSSSIGTGTMFNSSGMSYRLGWRTETWDLPDLPEEQSPGASLYLALRAIYRERDHRAVDTIVRNTLFGEMDRLQALGSENLAEIREVIQNLMCLCQVARWRDKSIQKHLKSKHIDFNDWTDFIQIDSDFDFLDLENIMATRISLIRAVRQKEERQQMGTMVTPFAQALINIEKKCLVRLSEAARDAHQIQIALNSMIRAQMLERLPSFEVSQEFANVLWIQKEEKLAVQFLKELVGGELNVPFRNQISATQKASLLARLGAWTSEACLEKPTDIWTNCFYPATSLVNDMKAKTPNDLDPTFAAVYHQCAVFAERQYHAILKSPDAMRWKVYVERKTQEIQHREGQIKAVTPSERSALCRVQDKAKKQLTEDRELFRKHNSAREAFLEQAIDMYSRCLETSDSFDADGAIRLCSLWFANFDEMGLQDKVRIALDRVPSRKLVLLAHQLTARLSKSTTTPAPMNQENLQRLVIRMCEEHPFHSLYQVYCLRPDRSIATPTGRHSDQQSPSSTQTEREAAAVDIFDRLRDDATRGERVRAVEHLCNACLQWAKFPIKEDPRFNKTRKKTPFKVPDGLLIGKISNLRVPVLTFHTPLDPTLRYDDCTWIYRYEATFETAGGVNLPKISICHSTDGQKYKQLFKGEGGDDLRQDAVMEQVFDLVNNVLLRDRETRRRNLSVRDYRVIPLASQAGVLEFVGNTSPLWNWLNSAHLRYRPNDMKRDEASACLSRVRKECGGQAEPLLEAFLEIRKRLKPVMRHYFTERHKTPISWFAMRLQYTRSVATTSIVGHVLGLGDRHISNILLDNGSGEVVHIDLGIAFDQGKLLQIPETVPFRMTADMVDGMGTSGTQGVFQRCAEETLRVLREGSEVIMTVLEVFKHDPLHSWTASEVKVQRMQETSAETTANAARFGIDIGIDMSSGTAEEAADRALTSVARKLDKSLSVEYTVNELIAEATDPVNLATIYSGWSPQF